MLVFRSVFRPRMQPAHRDPFEGRLRVALGLAKARRVPVTLAGTRAEATQLSEGTASIEASHGRPEL